MTGPAQTDPTGELGREVPRLWQRNANYGGTLYAVQHGNLYVYNRDGEPTFRVEPFMLTRKAPLIRDAPVLSQLLATRHEVVDFAGRSGELDHLAAWRDTSPSQVGVIVVHGPGGQGKSRLAAEFARNSAAAGWEVRA